MNRLFSNSEVHNSMKYEVLYSDRHIEIVDEETVSNLIDQLELFERTDVLQIHRIHKNGKLGKTIWTEEEGLFVQDF